MSESQIYQELKQLFTLDIPSPVKQEDSYLDITRQRFRETIISRVYAYYLEKDNNADVANLFISSLLELVNEKQKIYTFSLQDYKCTLEVQTNAGNRIDLLIKSIKSEESIIIENKINHFLKNDLVDYWDSTKAKNKVGIVLSILPERIPLESKDKFIPLTHREWINKIIQKGIPTNLSAKQYIYLTDFINNMQQLSSAMEISEQAKFFFEHPNLIMKAIETHTKAKSYISIQLQLIAKELEWKLSSGNDVFQQIWDGHSHAYYTITMHELFASSRKIKIIIELFKDAILKQEELIELCKDDDLYKATYLEGDKKTYYVHFALRDYELTNEEVAHFSDYVVTKIKNDFTPLMNKILAYLNSSK